MLQAFVKHIVLFICHLGLERRSICQACWTSFTDVTRETGTQRYSTYGSYLFLCSLGKPALHGVRRMS